MEETAYEIQKWFQGKSPNSQTGCITALKLYIRYIEEKEGKTLSPTQLIDEIEEDRKKPARYGWEIEQRLKAWHTWLMTEYISSIMGKPLVLNSATSYVSYIMGFYRCNGYRISFTQRFSDLFPRKTKNEKRLVSPKDLELMIDNAKTLRDKAILLFLYEGGFDDSTLCSLNLGDVKGQLEKGEEFLTIKAYRIKEKWEFITHVGPWATKALNAYLKERKRKGHQLDGTTPLFAKEWNPKTRGMGDTNRIHPRLIQQMVRDVADRSGLIDETSIPKGGMSPIRPHVFRMAFKTYLESALRKESAPYVYAWLGHKTKYLGAYFKPNPLLSLKIYKSIYYEALAIRGPIRDVKDLEETMREMQGNIKSLEFELQESRKRYDELSDGADRLLKASELKRKRDRESFNEVARRLTQLEQTVNKKASHKA